MVPAGWKSYQGMQFAAQSSAPQKYEIWIAILHPFLHDP